MAPNIFIVTSAINVTSGVVNVEDRLLQTLSTAKSIKLRTSNSYIILAEGGEAPLDLQQRKLLLTEFDDILDLTYHPTIQFAHNLKVHSLYTKGPCEATLIVETCKILPRDGLYRIFKISGRYLLNDSFKEEDHLVPGKYVFKEKQPGVAYFHDHKDAPGSQLQNIDKYYTPFQYKSRLYSFCSSMLDVVTKDYEKIFKDITSSYINHGFIDIEHSTYNNINPLIVKELGVIGLSGIQAENGIEIKE